MALGSLVLSRARLVLPAWRVWCAWANISYCVAVVLVVVVGGGSCGGGVYIVFTYSGGGGAATECCALCTKCWPVWLAQIASYTHEELQRYLARFLLGQPRIGVESSER